MGDGRLPSILTKIEFTEKSCHGNIVTIVLFGFNESEAGQPSPNNYIVTAYQKEIG